MVRPSGRRGDADLGPVTDRTGRAKGRPVTASSRDVRGRHSTSDIPITPTPLAPGFHHGTGSRNKRPDVVRDVPAPTQKRKNVKPSDWEQTEAAEGGPVDLELIPSYGGHAAGRIWRGQNRGLLKCRSRYMALTG
ncbi:hypothetical protein M9H77_18809 [Catharanthus roseus]|uniref:Uncharacterized protein n=1 Tax=Catharanthus roseus TaxID=4058 RepID=A0ACC0B8G1_CATRO|nr:hypothetical protein M9H77_18809 [Catharanthus roseus]